LPRILFGVSPIGLGHATRALVLKEELERRGADVKLFSGGKAAKFIEALGVPVEDIVDDPVPTISRGEMRWASLWYLRSWLANRRTVRRTRLLFDANPHELVVCDEEFSGIVVAEGRNEKRIFISDELELGFAHSWFARMLERRVERWYRHLLDSVDVLIIPELGEDSGNKRFVGPIVRAPTMSCGDARRLHGIPEGRYVLFSMSGSGIGRELAFKVLSVLRDAQYQDLYLVITGNRGPAISGVGVHDLGVVADNQNLVACADLVVSTAGKSTIDEASAAGTPIVTIPIRHHAEQERNAAALGYTSADSERLAEIIHEKLGKRKPPRPHSGEKKAADAIMSLLGASG
jgi:UDP-N-acetylglucosamine--N-acetylmuramyl-(pentapeptide) pyrophosphoryl-undecaprenol N-acetylglucosamine transferase